MNTSASSSVPTMIPMTFQLIDRHRSETLSPTVWVSTAKRSRKLTMLPSPNTTDANISDRTPIHSAVAMYLLRKTRYR